MRIENWVGVCDYDAWVAYSQVDLTYSVAKFLVEQARGNTHAPASPLEENSLLIYNYQTTFTGKVRSLGKLC